MSGLPAAAKTMEEFVDINFDYLFNEVKLSKVGEVFAATFDEARRQSNEVSAFETDIMVIVI